MALVNTAGKGIHPQADNRRPDYFTDQHGRVWYAQVDKKTGDPVESLLPYHWTAPLAPSYLGGMFIPPEQYRKIARVPGKQVQHEIDYDQWRSDWHAAYGRWDQARIDITHGMTNGMEVVRQLENPSPAIRRIVGPGPFPPIEVIERMAEGDGWALGLTAKIPAWFTDTMHDEIVQIARQNRLFTQTQLKELGKLERAEANALIEELSPVKPQPKKRSEKALRAMVKDDLIEVAEEYGLVTAGETSEALIQAILASQAGTPVGV